MNTTLRTAITTATTLAILGLAAPAAQAEPEVCGPTGCIPAPCTAREQTYECEKRRADFLAQMLQDVWASSQRTTVERDDLSGMVASQGRQIAALERRGVRLERRGDRLSKRVGVLKSKVRQLKRRLRNER